MHIRSLLKNEYTGSRKRFLIRLDEEWLRYFSSSIINLYYYNKPNLCLCSALIHSTDIPIHGGYSRWSYWSHCSPSCGDGIRYRYRYCNSPTPQNNGRNCGGQKTEQRRCNTRIMCPGKQLD